MSLIFLSSLRQLRNRSTGPGRYGARSSTTTAVATAANVGSTTSTYALTAAVTAAGASPPGTRRASCLRPYINAFKLPRIGHLIINTCAAIADDDYVTLCYRGRIFKPPWPIHYKCISLKINGRRCVGCWCA